jgi:hypothetical protein
MSLLRCCLPRPPQTPPHSPPPVRGPSVELSTFHNLPKELWLEILKLLPLHALWRNARPTCRSWNAMALEIVFRRLVEPTIIDVMWHTNDKRVRQRLYPSIPKTLVPADATPFSLVARWLLPEFEKALNTGERKRYKCDHVVFFLSSGKFAQNNSSFSLSRITERKDVWDIEALSMASFDYDQAFFYDPSWFPQWRITFREGPERRSTSSRGDMHLDSVTIPIAHFVKLAAIAEEEEWPSLAKVDGIDRRSKKSRPNSGIGTPRRRISLD